MKAQKEGREKKMGELSKANSKKYFQSRVLRDVLDQ